MNILWLSHLLPYPPKGGVLQRSYNLLKEVSARHHVHLLSFNQKALLPTIHTVEAALQELRKICASVTVLPIPSDERLYGRSMLYASSIFTSTPFTINWLRSDTMAQALQEILRRESIHLIHFDTISLAWLLPAVSEYKKALNHHNIESDMMLQRSRSETNPLKRMYMAYEGRRLGQYEESVCGQFDVNLTCSRLDTERLHQRLPTLDVREVPNGVDLDYFQPISDSEEASSILMVGGMSWYPNRRAALFFAREVWPRLRRSVPDAKVTIVGRHPPHSLRRVSQSDSAFRVTGFVPDVRPYFARSMVCVCSIREGGGTRLKILDTFAMGRPLVAHPFAVEGIDAEPEIHYLAARTPVEFVDQIRRLFEDPTLRRNLSRESRSLVERSYDFHKIGECLSQLYEDLGTRGSRS